MPEPVRAGAPAAPSAIGLIEYVVECTRDDVIETWLVVRPDRSLFPRYRRMGMNMRPGCRVVVDAMSLRPLGVLRPVIAPTPLSSGFNPYFDLPPA